MADREPRPRQFSQKFGMAVLFVAMGLCAAGMTYIMFPIPALAVVPVALGLALAQLPYAYQ